MPTPPYLDDAYLGEIRLLAFPYAPVGWLYCQGQLLPINQNQSLFSLLGTQYGGNGTTTFALPDLRGRVIVGVGTAPGQAPYPQGQAGGAESVALTVPQLPAHSHPFVGTILTARLAEGPNPDASLPASGPVAQFAKGTPNAALGAQALGGTTSASGGNQAHENRQPLMALNYAIAVQGGEFPKRT